MSSLCLKLPGRRRHRSTWSPPSQRTKSRSAHNDNRGYVVGRENMPVGMEVTEDTPPDMLTGSMNLKLVLPSGKKIKTSVERSTPMMDLLVHVTTCHKLSPAAHVLQPYGERGVLPYKPSTPIGALDTMMVHIIPKNQLTQNQSNKMALKQVSQPFEQTYRIQVSLPRNQLYVLRAHGRTTIADIHTEICQEKDLDPTKYSLRHPKELGSELTGEMTIAEYKSNQLVLVSNRSNPANQFSTDDIINAIQNINNNNNNNIYAFEPSSRSLSPDSSMSPVPVQEPLKPLRKKKPPAPPPPNNKKVSREKNDKGVVGESGTGGPGRVICHSRTSSDSSGYHEASLLSESPPSNNSSLPDSLPRRSKLDSKLKGSRDQLGPAPPVSGTTVQQNQALSKSLIDLKAHHAESSASSSNAQQHSSLKPAQSTTSLHTARKKRAAPLPPPSAPPPMKTVVEERLNGNSDTGSENTELSPTERSRTLEAERKPPLDPVEKCRTLPPGLTMSSAVDKQIREHVETIERSHSIPDVEIPLAPPVARPRSFVGVIEEKELNDWECDGFSGALSREERKLIDGLSSNVSPVDDENRTFLEIIEEGVVCEKPKVVKRSRAPPVPLKRKSIINENDVMAAKPVAPPRRLSLKSESNSEQTLNSPNSDGFLTPDDVPIVNKRGSISSRISSTSEDKYYSADSESEDNSLNIINKMDKTISSIEQIIDDGASKDERNRRLITDVLDKFKETKNYNKSKRETNVPVVKSIPVQIEDNQNGKSTNYKEDNDKTNSSAINDDKTSSSSTNDDNVTCVEVYGDKRANSSVKIVAAQRKITQEKEEDSERIVIQVGDSNHIATDGRDDFTVSNELSNSSQESKEENKDGNYINIRRRFVRNMDNSRFTSEENICQHIKNDNIGSNSKFVGTTKSTSLIFNSNSLDEDLTKDHEFGDVRVKLKSSRPFSFGEWGSSSDVSNNSSRKIFADAFSKFDQAKNDFDNMNKEFFGHKMPNLFRKRSSLTDNFNSHRRIFDLNSPEDDSGVEITEVIDESKTQDEINNNDDVGKNDPVISEPTENDVIIVEEPKSESAISKKYIEEIKFERNYREDYPKVERIIPIERLDNEEKTKVERIIPVEKSKLEEVTHHVRPRRQISVEKMTFESNSNENNPKADEPKSKISSEEEAKFERRMSVVETNLERKMSEERPGINWTHYPVKNDCSNENKDSEQIENSAFSKKPISSVRNLLKSFEGLKSTDEKNPSTSWRRSTTEVESKFTNQIGSNSKRSSISSDRSTSVEDEVFQSNDPRGKIVKRGSFAENKTVNLRSRLRQVESTGDLELVEKTISGSRLRTKWPPKPNLSDERDLVMEDEEIDRIFNNATAEHGNSIAQRSPLVEGNDSGRDSTDSNEVRKPLGIIQTKNNKVEETQKIPDILPSPVKSVSDETIDWEYQLPAPPTFRDPPESPEINKKSDDSLNLTPRSAVMSELSSIISQRSSSVSKLNEDMPPPSTKDEIETTSTLDNFKITTYTKNTRSTNNINSNVSVRRNNSVKETVVNNNDREFNEQGANPTVKRSVSHVSLFVRPFDNSRSKTLDRNQDKQQIGSSISLRKTTSEFNIDSVGRRQERPQSFVEPQSLQSLQVLRSILPQLSRSQGSLNTIVETEPPAVKSPPEPVVTEKPTPRFEREERVAVSLSTWGERPKRQVSIKSDRDYVFGQGGIAIGKRISSTENLQLQDSFPTYVAPSLTKASFVAPIQKGNITSIPETITRQDSVKSIPETKVESNTNTEDNQSDDDKKPKRITNVYKNLDTGNTKPLRHILNDVSRIPVVRSVELKAPYKQDWPARNTGLDKLKERFETDKTTKETSPIKENDSFESTGKIRERFETAIKERYESTEKLFGRRDHIDSNTFKAREMSNIENNTFKPREPTKININSEINKPDSNQHKYESKVKIDGNQTYVSSTNKTETKIELNEIKTPLTNRYTSVVGIGGSDCEVRVRVKTSTGRSSIMPAQSLPPPDPRAQLLTSIRGFGGLDSLKKVRS